MREAITRAGYLMEQRLVPVVEKAGFKVTPNQRYQDPASGKAFELDLIAMGGWQIGKRGTNFYFPGPSHCLQKPKVPPGLLHPPRTTYAVVPRAGSGFRNAV